MRIALVSLARRGGMLHFHAELVNALHKVIPDTLAITAACAPASYYADGVSRFVVETGSGAAGTLFHAINPVSWRRLYNVLKKSNADLFHIVATHEWNPLLAQMIRLLGKPLVFTLHDPRPHIGAPLYIQIADGVVIRQSSAMVVLSQLGKEQLAARGISRDKVFVIPHGAYSFFTRLPQTEVKQEQTFLFFGRIEPYKGVDVLIKAFIRIAGDLPSWKLIIAGGGDVMPYLGDLRHPRIEVINEYVPDADVANLMRRSAIVVTPYIEATQSGVVSIAYAFARPVIATRTGALGEMVADGETGLLVSPGDVDELARAMKLLATDDALRLQMGRAAYEQSQTEWGWDLIAKKHVEAYQAVLNLCA